MMTDFSRLLQMAALLLLSLGAGSAAAQSEATLTPPATFEEYLEARLDPSLQVWSTRAPCEQILMLLESLAESEDICAPEHRSRRATLYRQAFRCVPREGAEWFDDLLTRQLDCPTLDREAIDALSRVSPQRRVEYALMVRDVIIKAETQESYLERWRVGSFDNHSALANSVSSTILNRWNLQDAGVSTAFREAFDEHEIPLLYHVALWTATNDQLDPMARAIMEREPQISNQSSDGAMLLGVVFHRTVGDAAYRDQGYLGPESLRLPLTEYLIANLDNTDLGDLKLAVVWTLFGMCVRMTGEGDVELVPEIRDRLLEVRESTDDPDLRYWFDEFAKVVESKRADRPADPD